MIRHRLVSQVRRPQPPPPTASRGSSTHRRLPAPPRRLALSRSPEAWGNVADGIRGRAALTPCAARRSVIAPGWCVQTGQNAIPVCDPHRASAAISTPIGWSSVMSCTPNPEPTRSIESLFSSEGRGDSGSGRPKGAGTDISGFEIRVILQDRRLRARTVHRSPACAGRRDRGGPANDPNGTPR